MKYLLRPTPAIPGLFILATLVLTAPMACEAPAATQADLLNGLPTDRSEVWFVEFGRISQRPSQQDHGWDELLVDATNGILDAELVDSAGITSAAFSINSGREGAAILLGNFGPFPGVLREAADKGEATLHTHRGLELFVVTEHSDLYVAVPDSNTLLLAQGDGALPRQLIEEMIDR